MKEERITSRKNPALQQVRKLLTSRRYREETGLFAADGIKLLAEAAKWKAPLETVVVQDGVELPELAEEVRILRVPEDVMASVSEMDAPQGAVFVCRMPERTEGAVKRGSILLDGIQDPGNLGTILRTADALDVPAILLDGCADPFSPKTVRASMGAVFRTPVVQMTRQAAVESARTQGIRLLATALHRDAQDLRLAPLADCAVIIGSEGQGICRQLLEAADGFVVIPMSPRCESLNAAVAAAIVMWQSSCRT